MASGDKGLQGVVRSLEQRRLAHVIRLMAIWASAGIYLMPVSSDLGDASQISNGKYKDGLPLILPDAKALEDFALRLVIEGCKRSMPFFQRFPALGSKTVKNSPAPASVQDRF